MSCHRKSWKRSPFMKGKEIIPFEPRPHASLEEIIKEYDLCFEGRNLYAGAQLFKEMIESGDTIFFGIAGAGIAGGMGGYVTSLIKHGCIDVICSTGAQVYHDAHFAFGLPVVQGNPRVNDNALDKDGTTRIYDTYIRMKETLMAQDELFRDFARKHADFLRGEISSADYSFTWGNHLLNHAPHPERSWVAVAAEYGVPIFWDSESNHSIGMNNAALYLEGINTDPSPSKSLLEGAALVYSSERLGFFELGGGGPKNWIQTLAPMVSQILGVSFEGADRGIQITTAFERDAGLSGCTFGEAVTWGKYKDASKGLVQIWGEYSILAPLLIRYALQICPTREPRRLFDKKQDCYDRLVAQAKKR